MGKLNKIRFLFPLLCLSCIIFILFAHNPIINPNKPVFQKSIASPSFARQVDTPENTQTFLEIMQTFPWKPFEAAVLTRNFQPAQMYATKLSLELYPFLLLAPLTPINHSCQPPPLNYSAAIHKCVKLDRPRKVGALLTMAYEVDVLEIYLYELDAVVDKFFLLESTVPHNPWVKSKPLIWEHLKKDPRFSPFTHKIVHFPMSQQIDPVRIKGKKWIPENLERISLWEKFVEWNSATKFFQDEDLLGTGDPDEIPDRNNIAFLKNCQLPSDPVNIGIWFPMGGLDTIYASDHPVSRHHRYTFGNPTYWTLGGAKSFLIKKGIVPRKLYGRHGGSFLLGGMHASIYSYPPYVMIKYLGCSSCEWDSLGHVIKWGMLYRDGNATQATKNQILKEWQHRTRNLTQFRRRYPAKARMIVKVPWFLQCNLDRYPSFKREWDPKLNPSVV